MSLTDLTPAELKEAMAAGDLLIDVREPSEFGFERIPGAVNAPLSGFEAAALAGAIDPSRVVLQCGSGKRSATAAERCRAAGFAVTRHLAGGIGAWKAAGLPVLTTDPATGAPRLR